MTQKISVVWIAVHWNRHGSASAVRLSWCGTHTWARFLSLSRSKLRLCLANHRAGYFSNLACDWLSIVWAYSEQETENGPCFTKLHDKLTTLNEYFPLTRMKRRHSNRKQCLCDGIKSSIRHKDKLYHLYRKVYFVYNETTYKTKLQRSLKAKEIN